MKDIKKTIIPICAICGSTLLFVLDKERNIMEVFPCSCQEIKKYEAEQNTRIWISEIIGEPLC